jgi:hypothetical protein
VREVAVPLWRFFLADAHTAARAGDSARMLECLGLALDFVPESQRERVLVAAAELAPPVSWGGPGAPVRAVPAPRVVVEVAADALRPMARIAWEHRVSPSVLPPIPAPVPEPPRAAAGVPRRSRAALVAVMLLLVAAVAAAGGVVVLGPSGAASSVLGDPVARALGAVSSGNPARALQNLEPLGLDAPSRAWLVRASAHEAMSDTPAAIRALAAAAPRDADGGAAALEAGDRLLRLGAVRQAADAYLYAVTPARSPAEIERIAGTQELAGFPERARRVRQR